MRQVFASARLENVEGIARFLQEHDIEVRITQGRSYKGGWGGRRTYRDSDQTGPLPAVWVVRSEDQPRARQLLREAGLLDSTRTSTDSFLAPSVHGGLPEAPVAAPPTRRAFRYKIALLIAIVIAVGLAWNATRKADDAPARASGVVDEHMFDPMPAATKAPAPAATTTVAPAEPVPGAYPVDTPPVLATTLAATELGVHDARVACLRIDGAPADADSIARLPKSTTRIDCTDTADADVLTLDVRGYRTDGSGTGTVELAVTSVDPGGRPTTQVRTLLVRRVELEWRVLRILGVR